MRRGEIRKITWTEPRVAAQRAGLLTISPSQGLVRPLDLPQLRETSVPTLDFKPASAEQEAQTLLRIGAEVEGALMVQYLYYAFSLLPGLSVQVPGLPNPILSDDWFATIRDVAKQEMGHLITVQNLLLSLGAGPHLDRENISSRGNELYPFPFALEPLSLPGLAKSVAAEAPRNVNAADKADYEQAVKLAGGAIGRVSRVGQIYERLYWLFQDGNSPEPPWSDLQNPFPSWPDWHVGPSETGLNQDRQAVEGAWRGDGADQPVDTAIYVLPIRDKASARQAIYRLALQGEGPIGDAGVTHFDKFLRIYRECRSLSDQHGAPSFVRKQAVNPRSGSNASPGTITDPTALAWAQLGNMRYQLLLLCIGLSLSISQTGTPSAPTASRSDFTNWALREMLASIKPISLELREMPFQSGTSPDDLRAGFPFELPDRDLPGVVPDELDYVRGLVTDSTRLRAKIRGSLNPTQKQNIILGEIDKSDAAILQKLGPAIAPSS